MRARELPTDEYGEWYAGYIHRIPDITLYSALDESAAALIEVVTHCPDDKVDYAYAPGKWTVKQCLQHLLDSERVFIVRALRIARGDQTPLPGFDQDDFARVADVTGRDFRKMIEEFRHVRQSTNLMFKSFTERDLQRIGTMSGTPASTRAIGFIISGHALHHATLYREKYGLEGANLAL